jgi:hypothetical protein
VYLPEGASQLAEELHNVERFAARLRDRGGPPGPGVAALTRAATRVDQGTSPVKALAAAVLVVLTGVLFSVGAYLMFTKLLGVNLARGPERDDGEEERRLHRNAALASRSASMRSRASRPRLRSAWTMRALRDPDAFPASDLVLRNALGGVSAAEASTSKSASTR